MYIIIFRKKVFFTHPTENTLLHGPVCPALLRGAQKMGLYLVSNLGQIGLNLAACVLLVPRIGFSGFWLSTWISAPAGLALAALLARIGAKQQS